MKIIKTEDKSRMNHLNVSFRLNRRAVNEGAN